MLKDRKLIEIVREWQRVADASDARAETERGQYARDALRARASELRHTARVLGERADQVADSIDEPQIDAIALATEDAGLAIARIAFAGGAIEVLVDLIQLGASLLVMKPHPIEAWLDEIMADVRRYGLVSSID